MKGDIIIIEAHHRKAAQKIVSIILNDIKNSTKKYSITVAGESGSGKSETAHAIAEELKKNKLNSIVLGQDDYFHFAPKSNHQKRIANPEWLGPHVEVNMELFQDNINYALKGKKRINKPLIDYDKNEINIEKVNLENIQVIIAEGTYTSLLKNINSKVFISRNRLDTLEHRRARNRGNEVNDPYIEQILKTEHKIIAGHAYLADFIITKDYEVIEA